MNTMRTLKLILLSWVVLMFFSCGSYQAPMSDIQAGLELFPDDSSHVNYSICVWDDAGLREEPGRSKYIKYLTTIHFGERVELLGDTQQVASRMYVNVKLANGEVGWVHQYLFADHATLGVITKTSEIYRRPDLMAFEDEEFNRGDIVAVLGYKDGWVKLAGYRREKSGWIKLKNNLSNKYQDLRLALRYVRAVNEESWLKRKSKLEDIFADEVASSSSVKDVVQKSIRDIEEYDELPSDRLYITSSGLEVHDTPETTKENIVKKLHEGTICKVLDIGPKVELEGVSDVWYKVEFEGQEGWVYGHFTSKKGLTQ